MAIESLTYLDIPVAKRRIAAVKAGMTLHRRLCDPNITPEQVELLRGRLVDLEKWASNAPEEEG